ncbi:MAG: hypothetical protein B1H11_02095 [Desulfobacteraceae bacterium 4484_190.1]|nr:MAG: hypothetical protein B1H11_02095 [Desulfobacteraceae bacterium 4484_190.1]
MELIQAFKKKEKTDPVKVARGDFRSLLRLSLNDLVIAGSMAIDQRLPECLSLFAREISRTDDGIPFRPELRRLVQAWLDDENQAKDWMDYLRRNERKMDPYLRSFLYPLLKTLLGEQDSESMTNDLSETA